MFFTNEDPVHGGLIDNIVRPGRNLTGFSTNLPIFGKRIEILRDALPGIHNVGVLIDADWNLSLGRF